MLHGISCEPAAGLLCKAVDFERAALPFTPLEAAARLAPPGGLVWLDSAVAGPGALSMLASAPEEIVTGNISSDAGRLRALLARHRTDAQMPGRAPAGGLFGWIGFDGEFVFGVCPRCLVFDHGSAAWLDVGGLARELRPAAEQSCTSPALEFRPLLDRADFIRSVHRAREYIAAGDIYQVNLAYPWSAPWPRDAAALGLYERLRAVSPAPFGAFVDLAGTRILSASPECFLEISGRRISTRPIKGTRARCPADPALDARAAEELVRSEKERAELLMITDLERNDLGIVCEFGSVAVPGLWEVESFAQVHHLVSTVTGVLREDVDHVSALRACFPGGSISGAPKKRALEIIRELEPHPRGIYTGAIGCFGFNGESRFSIAIRTAVLRGDEITFHVGAGIVADSDPEREYEETLHKAAGLLRSAGM
ncbi:MAG: chorismate-binding protein [Verrucomicrobiaceae bacterium]|nr:chorismate-binding protein [Verrucomicrobiaceae bacterium]